jgi:hypothetical protein
LRKRDLLQIPSTIICSFQKIKLCVFFLEKSLLNLNFQ